MPDLVSQGRFQIEGAGRAVAGKRLIGIQRDITFDDRAARVIEDPRESRIFRRTKDGGVVGRNRDEVDSIARVRRTNCLGG